jgi:CTP synthase (UTP-ammonia lyase)
MGIRLGIVGDRDPSFRPHTATDEAVRHAADALAVEIAATWVPTDRLGPDPGAALERFDGLWIAPGSPYRDIEGALGAIRFARDRDWPLVAT